MVISTLPKFIIKNDVQHFMNIYLIILFICIIAL